VRKKGEIDVKSSQTYQKVQAELDLPQDFQKFLFCWSIKEKMNNFFFFFQLQSSKKRKNH
jgi:hypoxanthine phosphoribosyltransferase